MTTKLTPSVHEAVVRRAKRYAARRGTSLSRLVSESLDLVSASAADSPDSGTPVLRMLRRAAPGASVADHRPHVRGKYR